MVRGDKTVDDRRDRVAQDDGDPDDTVYRVRESGRGDICYHDDEDCQELQTDDPADMPRREAHRRLYPGCSYCVLGTDRGRSVENTPSLRHNLDDVDYEFEWDRKHGDGEGAV
ncbi:hypothetical protein [Haloarcula laminariae]|uniref:hypothetical protein n=1 Tax=Haloarcula laminariae TaxID=2961577 RepID=UPI002404AF5A|nr:hypothetical protein [Halomicroarcula sp. FL173]